MTFCILKQNVVNAFLVFILKSLHIGRSSSFLAIYIVYTLSHIQDIPYNMNNMITSSNGNILHVTSHLCGESTGHRLTPHTMASDEELWYFLWSAPE